MSDTATTPGTEGTPATGGTGAETDTPTIESLTAQVAELTKNSRKWEDRAKANFAASQELDTLKASQMSDEEKRAAAITKAEKDVQDALARAEAAERDSLRFRIALQHGVSDEDAALFLTGSDEETMTKQAERLAGRSTGPKPKPAQGNRREGTGPVSPKDAFVETLEGLL